MARNVSALSSGAPQGQGPVLAGAEDSSAVLGRQSGSAGTAQSTLRGAGIIIIGALILLWLLGGIVFRDANLG